MESVKIIVMLAVAVLSQSVGNVLLSKGMKELAGPDPMLPGQWGSVLLQAALSPTVLAGAALFVVFFVLWTIALSRADLSFVLPATAFGYVINVACGYYFLHEAVTPARWAGSLLICLGVFCVSRSEIRTALTSGRAGEP